MLVVNTASRGLPVEGARQVSARSARSLLTSGCRPVYKKIDSTLKGPWCQELAAVMAVVRPDFAHCGARLPGLGKDHPGRKAADGRPASANAARPGHRGFKDR